MQRCLKLIELLYFFMFYNKKLKSAVKKNNMFNGTNLRIDKIKVDKDQLSMRLSSIQKYYLNNSRFIDSPYENLIHEFAGLRETKHLHLKLRLHMSNETKQAQETIDRIKLSNRDNIWSNSSANKDYGNRQNKYLGIN